MKKRTLFLAAIFAVISLQAFAGVDPSTAWWNNATFETDTAGTNLKDGWTDGHGSPYVLVQSIQSQTNGSASNRVLGICLANDTTFQEVSQSGDRAVYKTFDNALTGLVYIKTSAYHCTTGTTYSLRNSSDSVVFEFGGNNNKTGAAIFFTGEPSDSISLGGRGTWSDYEFLLDLNNRKLIRGTVTYAGTSKTYSNIDLPSGTDLKTLYVTMYRSYVAAGFDNTTFGTLLPNEISDMTGDTALVLTEVGAAAAHFSVSSFANVMDTTATIASTKADITWSISDWGNLSAADQARVTLTRDTANTTMATLSAKNISADDTITVQAAYGDSTLTQKIFLKAYPTVADYAKVDSTTAWWYNENFEEDTVGTNLKDGWTDGHGSPNILVQTLPAQTTGSANSHVMGIDFNGTTTFGEVGQGGDRNVYKIFNDSLSGLVYFSASAFNCTNGTTYTLKNSSDSVVFQFGGVSSKTGSALWITGKTASEVNLGNRGQWSDFQFLIDLNNNKIVKAVLSNSGTSKTYTNIDLANGTNLKSLYVDTYKGYEGAGFDNITFGSVMPEGITNFTGDSALVLTRNGNVSATYNVSEFAVLMDTLNILEDKSADIQWSVSDWGGMSAADQAKVTLTKDTTDARMAELSAANISADATITLQATLGSSTITKQVFLKSFYVAPDYSKVDSTTAWWYNDDFEAVAWGTDLKTGWTDNGGSPFVMAQYIQVQHTSTANHTVFGISLADANAFGEVSQSGNRGVYKNFNDSLTGLVLIKTSAYHCTTGTTYSLKNSDGTTVFEFGGVNNKSGAATFFTGEPNDSIGLGNRGEWSDFEFLLDLNNNKLIKGSVSNSGVTKTYSNIDLPAGTNLKSLYVTMYRSYVAAGFDNTTMGSVLPDGIQNLTGDTAIQTLPSGAVTTSYNVTTTVDIMDSLIVLPNDSSDIQWSVADWGGMSTDDQAKVTLTRDSTDTRMAVLSADNVSADDTITLQATYGTSVLTKQVVIKTSSTAGLKDEISSEIIKSNALMVAVTDSNVYVTNLKDSLTSYVNAGQVVVDNTSATIEEANTALLNLQGAEVTFTEGMAPYNNFMDLADSVLAVYSNETRTAKFILAERAKLFDAINASITARQTIADSADIADAKTALATVLTQYYTDLPVYTNLETQISEVDARITAVTPYKGDDRFLMYSTASVDSLASAKSSAENVLANDSTVDQLNTSITTLATALTTFNATPRVAPGNQAYKIYTYGVDNGDGDSIKNIVFVDASGTVKYAPDGSDVQNTEWIINKVDTANTYTFMNKTLGTYLNGMVTADTAIVFTLPEGTSKDGSITGPNDTYFLYNIVTPSGKGLEVDAFDAVSSTGTFKTSSSPAPRYRFCFQFEPVPPVTSVVNPQNQAIKVYTANNNLIIDGIKTGNRYAIYNILGEMVKTGVATSNRVEISIANGIYLVKAENNVYKIVK